MISKLGRLILLTQFRRQGQTMFNGKKMNAIMYLLNRHPFKNGKTYLKDHFSLPLSLANALEQHKWSVIYKYT